MLRYYLLFFIFFLSQALLGQDPAFITIGKSELANKDIYSILETKSNRLILATDHGLYEYKQRGVFKLKESDSQIGKSLFNLKEDNKGNVFCCNLNGQIFVLRDNRLELYYHIPDSLLADQIIFEFDDKNNLIVGAKYLLCLNNEKQLNVIKNSDEASSISYLAKENGNILFSYSSNRNVFQYQNGKVNSITNRQSHDKLSVSARHFLLRGKIYSINQNRTYDKGNTIKIPLKVEDSDAYIYSRYNSDNILAISRSRGALILSINETGSLESEPKFFKQFMLSSHFLNKNGTHFYGTFGQGLIMVLSDKLRSKQFDEREHLLRGLCASNDTVYVTSSQGEVLRMDKQDGYKVINKVPNTLGKIFRVENDIYYSKPSEINLVYDLPFINGQRNPMGNIKDVCELQNSNTLIASSNGLYCISKDSVNSKVWDQMSINGLYRSKLIEGRLNSLAYDEANDIIYISKSSGVFAIENNELRQLSENSQPIYSKSIVFSDGTLYVATHSKGIICFSGEEVKLIINSNVGLKSNQINKLRIRGKSLYIGHDKGLQIFDIGRGRVIKNKNLEKLISHDVLDFDLSGRNIVFLNNNTVYEIPVEKELIKVPDLILKLDSVWINDRYSNKKRLDYDENNIRLKITANSIEHFHSAQLKYRLLGFEKSWNHDYLKSLNFIEYKHLPPGKYSLLIKYESGNGGAKELRFNFEIAKPYWSQWWFILLFAVACLILISAVYLFQIKKIRKKNEKELQLERSKSELLEAKLKTLRAQMNPHFIFNSLNSIQDLILNGDADLSYDYLVKFSDLVRKALKYSEKDIIKVSEELDFLKVYLELEELRFEDDFEFEFNNHLNRDVKIPSMIIQPIVENALLHGLKHKKGDRRLEIEIIEDENLICFVRDNGVGRKRAKEIGSHSENHLSFATKSISKRLEYYFKSEKDTFGIYYNDLEVNGKPMGTEVKLVLPIL